MVGRCKRVFELCKMLSNITPTIKSLRTQGKAIYDTAYKKTDIFFTNDNIQAPNNTHDVDRSDMYGNEKSELFGIYPTKDFPAECFGDTLESSAVAEAYHQQLLKRDMFDNAESVSIDSTRLFPPRPGRRHFGSKNSSHIFNQTDDGKHRYSLTSSQYGIFQQSKADSVSSQDCSDIVSASSIKDEEITHGLSSAQLNRPSRGKGGRPRESLMRGSQVWF